MARFALPSVGTSCPNLGTTGVHPVTGEEAHPKSAPSVPVGTPAPSDTCAGRNVRTPIDQRSRPVRPVASARVDVPPPLANGPESSAPWSTLSARWLAFSWAANVSLGTGVRLALVCAGRRIVAEGDQEQNRQNGVSPWHSDTIPSLSRHGAGFQSHDALGRALLSTPTPSVGRRSTHAVADVRGAPTGCCLVPGSGSGGSRLRWTAEFVARDAGATTTLRRRFSLDGVLQVATTVTDVGWSAELTRDPERS